MGPGANADWVELLQVWFLVGSSISKNLAKHKDSINAPQSLDVKLTNTLWSFPILAFHPQENLKTCFGLLCLMLRPSVEHVSFALLLTRFLF